jgi:hypothetical protein
MKKVSYLLSVVLMGALVSCGGGQKPVVEEKTCGGVPKVVCNPQVELCGFDKDADGWITLFNGKDFTGWRGYNKEEGVPGRWIVEDGAIKINGSGTGEGQSSDGGDIIFAYKFKNFELSIDWKVSKGGNSGIFYLAQEIEGEPIYISAPESQILDNENHPDAKMGVDGNRQSSSLYDMIPANPQNAKPFGEWNTTKIMVYKGTVVHNQNGQNVLEYHLWTKQWTEMLQNSKFKEGSKDFPLAFGLLNNCGGENKEGYIGLQDHGDDVWFKNIKIKIME